MEWNRAYCAGVWHAGSSTRKWRCPWSWLIGAGMLIRSLRDRYQADTGFIRDKVLVGWVFPVLAGYDRTQEMNLYRKLMEALNAIPGVQSASLSRYRLLFASPDRKLFAQGEAPDANAYRSVYCYPVGPRFFGTRASE